ncbi:uncharacterized protein LOC116413650 [Galleria mellonella]|uniref:Uncharacterized protein LOC116413650 n=1 Tax=Galleria mellonella TaxID=7137 RepID=A0ABM3MR68_GALME|nr:uncharacterized protein LOC116413650 [Galleria mellonella]
MLRNKLLLLLLSIAIKVKAQEVLPGHESSSKEYRDPQFIQPDGMPTTPDPNIATDRNIIDEEKPFYFRTVTNDNPFFESESVTRATNFSLQLDDYQCPRSNGYFVYQNDCKKFVECQENVGKLYFCPSGYQYNRMAVWPDPPCGLESEIRCQQEEVTVPSNMSLSARPFMVTSIEENYNYQCPNNGYFDYQNDCMKFVGCQENHATLYTCPPGYRYNRTAESPDYLCGFESEIFCTQEDDIIRSTVPPRVRPFVVVKEYHDYQCPGNGYFNYQNDCMKFVGCQEDHATLYTCPPGYRYNRTAESPDYLCGFESEIFCTQEDDIIRSTVPPRVRPFVVVKEYHDYQCPGNGYFNYQNDCMKFVGCQDNHATLYTCPPGYRYNRTAESPDYLCGFESEIFCTQEEVVIRSTVPPSPSPIILINEIYDYQCSNNGYFVYQNDCFKFVGCQDNHATLYTCPPGYKYNRTSASPDYICGLESEIFCQQEEAIIPSTVPPSPPPIMVVKVISDYQCPGNGYFVYQNDCFKFVGCQDNFATLYTCPPGYKYNRTAASPAYLCGLESEIFCQEEIMIRSTEPPSPPFITVIKEIYDYQCPNNGYFIYQNDCMKFVGCQDNHATLYTCPPGYQYNRTAVEPDYLCRPEFEIGCETAITPEKDPVVIPNEPSNYQCSRHNGYFSVEYDCNKFIECKEYEARMYSCPMGYYYNYKSVWPENPCGLASEVNCVGRSYNNTEWRGNCDNIFHDIFPFGDMECGKYVVCDQGTAITMACPEGLVFNANRKACDWPVNVPACNPDVFRGFTCPEPMRDDRGRMSDIISKFRYEHDCSKFIACQRGYPRLLSCDAGFYFSDVTRSCVHAALVHNCIPTPPKNDMSTTDMPFVYI